MPFLHTYSLPLSKRENRIGDFEAMRYSTRYRYLVDAPGIHHWDFATEGMAASAVLGNRGPDGPALQQAFEMTNRYVLQFFNAYVKHDREAVAFLRRDPQANGAAAGLVTVREYPRYSRRRRWKPSRRSSGHAASTRRCGRWTRLVRSTRRRRFSGKRR